MTSPVEQRLSDALHDIVAQQPFEPDPADIERRGRRLLRRAQVCRVLGTGVAVAVAAVTVAVTVHPTPLTTGLAIVTPGAHPAAKAPEQPLVELGDDLQALPKPVGDATLVVRNRVLMGRPIQGWDLYGDNGTYYYADTRAGLPGAVSRHEDNSDGGFGREVAVAVAVGQGADVVKARVQMANAALDPVIAEKDPVTESSKTRDGAPMIDNRIWENCQDAITAGAGNPLVRAGVLRLLSTLSDVKVAHTITNGRPTLTLAATAPAMPRSYSEVLVISADNGFPVAFSGGDVGKAPSVTIQFQVSRVTLADVAAGKF